MLVSGSSRSAIRPRERSGRSRFSYGYLRVTGRGRTKCSSVRSIPRMIPLTGSAQSRDSVATHAQGWWCSVLAGELLVPRSSVNIPEHDVDGAEDRDGVRDEPALKQPGEDLEVHEGRAAHLRAERVRAAAVADHVDADLALRAFDRVVRLALRAFPHVAEPRAHRASGELVDALADERDGEAHLAESHAITCVGVAVGVDDGLERRELRVDRVRTVTAKVPVHARPAQHRPGESVRLRDVAGDRPDADRSLEEDLVLVEDRDVVLFDVLLIPVQEPGELAKPPGRQVVEQAARPVVVEVHAGAAELLE